MYFLVYTQALRLNCTRKLKKIERTTETICVNVYFALNSKCYFTVRETASSDTGITFSTAASDSGNSLFLKPPPGSEIPRSASVSSALPRPRPQVE